MLSDLGRMKSEDDRIFRYSNSDKFICDAIFNPIIVNPNFLLADFGMNDTAMNLSIIFPAFMYQHLMVAIAAGNNISNHITIMVRKIGILGQPHCLNPIRTFND